LVNIDTATIHHSTLSHTPISHVLQKINIQGLLISDTSERDRDLLRREGIKEGIQDRTLRPRKFLLLEVRSGHLARGKFGYVFVQYLCINA
jgi:hypothetical protein